MQKDHVLLEINDNWYYEKYKLRPTEDIYAVRGIIFDAAGQIAIIHAKEKEYYELPGGGVELGESVEAALIREMREETGITVNSLQSLGCVLKHSANIELEDVSYGFSCAAGEKAKPLLIEEEELDYEVVWAEDLETAICLISSKNANRINEGNLFPLKRDLAFLETLRNKKD